MDINKRIIKLCKNKVNFIAGTIAPAPASKQNSDLESLVLGLEYFYNCYKDIPNCLLSIQIKDMGSRCQFYYFKNDKEKSYCVSRNGFILSLERDTINKIYDILTIKLTNFNFFANARLIIIDGELMPWSAVGDSLIKSSFYQPLEAASNELKILEEFDFVQQEKKLIDEYNESGFREDINVLSRSDLNKKYEKYNSFSVINENIENYLDMGTVKKDWDTFDKQIKIYGAEHNVNDINYKPFSILKVCLEDNSEFLPDDIGLGNVEMYQILSDNPKLFINLDNTIDFNIELIESFKNQVSSLGNFEGLIIKPNFPNKNFAPCMKVRNKDYLHIVYGPHYLTEKKYNLLINKKNIKHKLKLSIKEHELGNKMLRIRFDNINETNEEIIKLYSEFLQEEDSNKFIDKAL